MFTPLQPPGIISPEAALRWVEENFRDLEQALKSVGKRQAYQPIWTTAGAAPTLGNGVLKGSVVELGSSLLVTVNLTFGSTTNPGTGIWRFSVPRMMVNTEPSMPGPLALYDTSASFVYGGASLISPAVTTAAPESFAVYAHGTAGVRENVPFTWAVGDNMWASVFYPIE